MIASPSRAADDVFSCRATLDRQSPYVWVTLMAEEIGKVAHNALRLQFGGAPRNAYRAGMVRLAAMALAAVECTDREDG